MFTCTLRTTLLALGICPVSDVQCVSVSRVYATPRSVSSDSSRSGQARVRAEARPGKRERPPVGREAVKPADWSQTQSHSSESGQLRLRLRPQCINCKEFLWKCNFNRDSFVVHHLWNLKSWIMQHNTRVQKSLRVKQVLASPSQLTLKLSSIPEYYPRYIFSIAQIVSFFCYVNSFY